MNFAPSRSAGTVSARRARQPHRAGRLADNRTRRSAYDFGVSRELCQLWQAASEEEEGELALRDFVHRHDQRAQIAFLQILNFVDQQDDGGLALALRRRRWRPARSVRSIERSPVAGVTAKAEIDIANRCFEHAGERAQRAECLLQIRAGFFYSIEAMEDVLQLWRELLRLAVCSGSISISAVWQPSSSAMASKAFSNTVLPTPRRPSMIALFAARPPLARMMATRAFSISVVAARELAGRDPSAGVVGIVGGLHTETLV